MENTINLELLDAAAVRHRRRAETVESIRAIAADDPDFIGELRHALSGAVCMTPPKRQSVSPTNLDRVVAFFSSNGREWYTAPEIIQGTALKRSAVGQVLYRAAPERFERKAHPKDRKMKLWRLKPE